MNSVVTHIEGEEPREARAQQSNKALVGVLVALILGMFAFAFANAPLFGYLCSAIGIELNPNNAALAASTDVSDREVRVFFTGNVMSGLPVAFRPSKSYVKARLGEEVLVDYHFTNLSDEPVYFNSIHDVLPARADDQYSMLACFCLDHQMLHPRQKATLPLRFKLGTGMPENVTDVTVNYTLFQLSEDQYDPQGVTEVQGYTKDAPPAEEPASP